MRKTIVELSVQRSTDSGTDSNNQHEFILFQNTLMNRVPAKPPFLKDLNCHCIDPNKDFVLNAAGWTNPAPVQWGTFQVCAEFLNIFNRTCLADPALTAPTSPQARDSAGVPISGWGYINPTSLKTQLGNGQLAAEA